MNLFFYIYIDAYPSDIHLPNIQAESENKEYENPDFCLPQNEGLSGALVSGSQSYETIDIMKVDYVSVYNTPSNIANSKQDL